MTHLVFALVTTAYILVAIQLEERDLVDALGDDYRRYRERVPMIIPFSKARFLRRFEAESGIWRGCIYKRAGIP